ncbi:MAG: hypothetical protein RL375_3940 [Pseudomonadota bacterium]|jgi:hypothetical protein
MHAYVVIGNPNTRKSSVLRCLTGCFNRSVRDIQLQGGTAPLRLYARVGALQESRTTADEFELEISRKRCAAVAFCLWPSAHPLEPGTYPDAQTYLDAFRAKGWTVDAIAVLGQNAGGVKHTRLRQFPQASTDPINLTAQQVRSLFGWC